jgi:hypothetical protein
VIKLLILGARKPGWSEDEFFAHYIDRHGPLVAGSRSFTRNCARYVQNYAMSKDASPAIDGHCVDHDAISELWFETFEAMGATYEDAKYLKNVRPDELRFSDFNSVSIFACGEHEIKKLQTGTEPDKAWAHQPRYRLFVFRSPRADRGLADFQQAWLTAASVIQGVPAFERYVRRYVQSHVADMSASNLPGVNSDRTAVVDEFTFVNGNDALEFGRAFHAHPGIRSLTDKWTHAQAHRLFFARSHPVFEDEAP